MTKYTIIATIYRIENSTLFFKGVGEYLKKIDSYQRNILLSDGGKPEYLTFEKSCFELRDTGNLTSDALYRKLLLRSMLDKRPLKLTLKDASEDNRRSYELFAVEAL